MKIFRILSIFYLVVLLANCGNPQQPDNNFYQELQTDKSWYLDSAIKNGYLSYELYNWYGSAALPGNLEISDKIWKIKP